MTVEVRVACPCPGTPHPDGDTVGLREKLGLAAGIALQTKFAAAWRDHQPTEGELLGLLAEAYLLEGVESWTFVDADGQPVAVNDQTISEILLADFSISRAVGDAADGLYTAPVILPLVTGAVKSLRPSLTNGSTSASSQKSPKRSKRSSTTTTPTDDTEAITPSLAGVSSS